MKKQINPTIKAHLLRSAFYLLLLVAVCAIPFALAQRNAAKRSLTKPVAKANVAANMDDLPRATGPVTLPDAASGIVPSGNTGAPLLGAQAFSATNQPFTQSGSTFTVNLPSPAVLTAGTYWVEIQANMTFNPNGEWGWTDRTVQSNNPAAWQNPGGGFGMCPTWTVKTVCIPTAGGPDQVYRLNGTIGGGTPTPTPTGSPTPTPTATPTPTPTPGPCTFRVLIAYADIGGQPTTLQNEILAEPGVIGVDLFDAFSGTPTLQQLQQYNIVYAFSNNGWFDAVAMGNVLADYQDAGGIVVVSTFAWDNRGPWLLGGRWVTGGYSPFNSTSITNFSFNTANITQPGHPLMQGVSSLGAFYRNGLTLASGAASVADWTDGPPAVAYKTNNGTTAVGINAYLGYLNQFSGEWGRLIVNAGRWLANCQATPTPTPTGTPSPTPTPTCTPGWRIEPSMLNARAFASGALASNAFYAITGFNGTDPYVTATNFFNGSVWATGSPIPVPHSQSRATSIGDIIYVPGGFNSIQFGGPLDVMQIYNTTTNTWSMGMNLPAARSGGPAVAFNGLVYVIGGYNPVGTGHTDVYIYNPASNSYTTGAPMPAGQGNLPGVLLNGEVYVVGGGTAPGAQYAYNPTANTWRTIAPLPTSGGTCQAGGGFVQDNELWIVGCLGLPINQQVWIYNPGTNAWRAGP